MFRHDCGRCVFLGSFSGNDLYFCTQAGGLQTVIARHGSDPHCYSSGMTIARSVARWSPADPLAEALRRSEDKGLVQRKERA